MASTPKVIRRNKGTCVCPDHLRLVRDGEYQESVCRTGRCFVARCWFCNGEVFSAGPIDCPCKKGENPRWVFHPGMEQPGRYDLASETFFPSRAAVKPSVMRRRNRRPLRMSC